jgi:hypothetical protein
LAKLDWTLGFQCITGDQSPGFCAPVIYFSGFSAAQKSQRRKFAGSDYSGTYAGAQLDYYSESRVWEGAGVESVPAGLTQVASAK